MAATKFTAIYANNNGKIIEREIPGMNTYKIAEKVAIMLNNPEVAGLIKLQIKGGVANPSPPVGPALGSKGVNIMEFCKQFNARTQDKAGLS